MAKVYKAKLLGNEGIEMQTGKVRLSFPHLFEKYKEPNGDEGKYQCTLLIDKDDKATASVMKKAIEAAKESGKSSKWNGKIPGSLKLPYRDGDDSEYDEYEGTWSLSAKSNSKPKVTDVDGDELFDQEDIYPGCYVRAVLKFLPYDNSGKGITCVLERIQKIEDGDPLGGSGSGSDFEDDDEDLEDDDDDEDLEDDDDLGL